MAIGTYSELQAAVIDWANRGDLSARVADFVRLGEERIGRNLRVSGMVKIDTLVVPASQNWVALPADWLEFKRIRSTAEPLIEYMAPDALDDLPAPGRANAYSIEGGRLLYGQSPSANLTLDVRYYAMPALLSATPTNWLLSASPSLYLYAALIECAIFVKDSKAAGEWGTLFDKVVAELQSQDKAAAISGSRLRGQP